MEGLKASLVELSGKIQDSLFNGSNPALQAFISQLEGHGPYELSDFAVQTKELASMTESTISTMSSLPKTFALNESYRELLKAQNKRLEMFRKLGSLKGKATPNQVKKMRKAIKLWQAANKDLEVAIGRLNTYIASFDALSKAAT